MTEDHSETSAETHAGIRATIESYAALREAGDVDGLVNLFTAQGSVMPPGASASVGRDALLAAFEPFRTAPGLECTYEFDEILA